VITKGIGQCRIDGVQIGEVGIQVDPSTASVLLSSKFAYVNTETQIRYGFGHKSVEWSEETTKRLVDLLESMGQDISRDMFGDGETVGSGSVEADSTTDGVPGF